MVKYLFIYLQLHLLDKLKSPNLPDSRSNCEQDQARSPARRYLHTHQDYQLTPFHIPPVKVDVSIEHGQSLARALSRVVEPGCLALLFR